MSASADDRYEQENDQVSGDVPSGDAPDNDYVSRPGQSSEVPVISDDKAVEDPIDPATADSDATLEADERNAIDDSNIMDSRTRGAPKEGAYTEPGDEEGLPANDGRSAIAQ